MSLLEDALGQKLDGYHDCNQEFGVEGSAACGPGCPLEFDGTYCPVHKRAVSQFGDDSSGSGSGGGSGGGLSQAAADAGMPPAAGEAITAVQSMVPANDQKYVDQGASIANAAEGASQGNYAGMIAAAGGLVNDLPPSTIRTVVSDILVIAEYTAMGAAIGSAMAPYGTAIGAVIGSIIGIFEDIFGNPPVIQNDFRGTSQQMVFPAASKKGAPYSFVPGSDNRNPRDQPDSIFYTLDGVAPNPTLGPITNMAIAEDFGFSVSYVRPPRTNAHSQNMGWLLAQVYTGTDDVSRMNALAPSPPAQRDPGGLAARQKQLAMAQQMLETALGGPAPAKAALLRLQGWYGSIRGWGTALPSVLQATQNITFPNNQPGKMKFFRDHPLDYLYYPQYASWNGSVYSYSDPVNASDVYLTVDPLLMALAELAVLDASDLIALHYVMGLVWLWNRGLKQDHITNPKIDMSPHRNFLRVIGLISERVRNTMKAIRATPQGAAFHAKKAAALANHGLRNGTVQKMAQDNAVKNPLPHTSSTSGLTVGGSVPTSPIVVAGGLALGSGALYGLYQLFRERE